MPDESHPRMDQGASNAPKQNSESPGHRAAETAAGASPDERRPFRPQRGPRNISPVPSTEGTSDESLNKGATSADERSSSARRRQRGGRKIDRSNLPNQNKGLPTQALGDQELAGISDSDDGAESAIKSARSSASPLREQSNQRTSSRRRRGSRSTSPSDDPIRYSVGSQLANETRSELLSTSRRANQRLGKSRNGRPLGRYLMCVHKADDFVQIAVLEGRTLIEHYVSKVGLDPNSIDGNIYLGRVTNVLAGMEAAFVDIGTSKNAVLYRGDVRFDRDDLIESSNREVRIEHLLRPRQVVLCQITKNPIGTKGARLTQEVSLPGRFVVLVPNSDSYGISKRLPDDERRRLRRILGDMKPEGFGVIVRTAAEGASADELERDITQLVEMWKSIESKSMTAHAPTLLYSEPNVAVRVIREEFNRNYRGVIIDDQALFDEVHSYVASISPELSDRVELYDAVEQSLPLFELHHVHEQLHKAMDRRVWLPSGGYLVIDRAEALTVIDVNTGKNVGTVSLEETIYQVNTEAASEIARQLRLRDIGGIIVIDFIDMSIEANKADVMKALKDSLSRDKTKTQVFEMSALGLVEMTRQRVSEGLVEALSDVCPTCKGRGMVFMDVDIM